MQALLRRNILQAEHPLALPDLKRNPTQRRGRHRVGPFWARLGERRFVGWPATVRHSASLLRKCKSVM